MNRTPYDYCQKKGENCNKDADCCNGAGSCVQKNKKSPKKCVAVYKCMACVERGHNPKEFVKKMLTLQKSQKKAKLHNVNKQLDAEFAGLKETKHKERKMAYKAKCCPGLYVDHQGNCVPISPPF